MEITREQIKEMVEKYKEDKTSLKLLEADVLKVLIDYVLNQKEDNEFYGDLLEDALNELDVKEHIEYDNSKAEVTLKKILKSVDNLEKEQKAKKKHKPIRRVICILVTALIVLGVFSTVVCVANKVTPFNNIFNDKPLETTPYEDPYKYYTDLNTLVEDYPMFVMPTYIPTGYELTTAKVYDVSFSDSLDFSLEYYKNSNLNDSIFISGWYEDPETAILTEYDVDEGSVEYVNIEGVTCTFFTNYTTTGVIWDNGKDIQYTIITMTSREELEKILKPMLMQLK